MELYPAIIILSDVHCPICVVMSCNGEVSSGNVNDRIYNSKYSVSNNVRKWNEDMSEQYTSSFNMETIFREIRFLICLMLIKLS